VALAVRGGDDAAGDLVRHRRTVVGPHQVQAQVGALGWSPTLGLTVVTALAVAATLALLLTTRRPAPTKAVTTALQVSPAASGAEVAVRLHTERADGPGIRAGLEQTLASRAGGRGLGN
jgi:hypothetical protein